MDRNVVERLYKEGCTVTQIAQRVMAPVPQVEAHIKTLRPAKAPRLEPVQPQPPQPPQPAEEAVQPVTPTDE